MGQSDSITSTPPETGSDVNITVNEGVDSSDTPETPAEEAPTESESNDDGGDSGDSAE